MTELTIMTVCTHNRARSVAMTEFLRHGLHRRGFVVKVTSAGFREEGLPATAEVTDALAARGFDVRNHVSRWVDDNAVSSADLILTAERMHVVQICERRPEAFGRTFTLPELVLLGEAAGARGPTPLARWLQLVARDRTPAGFLNNPAGEIADPTGRGPIEVAASIHELAEWCQRLVTLL